MVAMTWATAGMLSMVDAALLEYEWPLWLPGSLLALAPAEAALIGVGVFTFERGRSGVGEEGTEPDGASRLHAP
jgi:hypothetical protein